MRAGERTIRLPTGGFPWHFWVMRRLILMRHAKSSWADAGQRDIDRPLNGRGRRSAPLMAAWLRDRGYGVDAALVSSAARTRESWTLAAPALGRVKPKLLPALYHAGVPGMLAALRGAPDVETVLLLAHMPGIGELARLLVMTDPEDPEFDRFPTSATAVLEFDVARWAEVESGTGHLAAFTVPRALERRGGGG